MIDETKQEMAIDFVLGELSPMAAESFEQELAGNEELRSFTKELREGFASMALTTEPLRPRSELFQRILTEVNSPRKSKLIWASFVPWALAACLAAALLILGFDDLRKKTKSPHFSSAMPLRTYRSARCRLRFRHTPTSPQSSSGINSTREDCSG
jgi:anti-sigma-K factor RskA